MIEYIGFYFIGMFIYVFLKGLKIGFFEIERETLLFWEIVFYPFYVVLYLGKYIGFIIITIIEYIINLIVK